MSKVVIAGASCIDEIKAFIQLTSHISTKFILIENEFMHAQLSPEDQLHVINTNTFKYNGEIFIPLNEYWVSKAQKYKAVNISKNALRASRSKHFLSKLLSQHGVSCPKRYFLDELPKQVPTKFIARLDAGYSGYGIASYQTLGKFDKETIQKSVLQSSSLSMESVLSIDNNRIVIERYLEGSEYSADVFVEKGNIKIIRLFYKIIRWVNGKPVCDSYISVPLNKKFSHSISRWCQILFGNYSTSFGQFDFITAKDKIYPIDFSCRIGGGLHSIKRFSSTESYLFNAIYSNKSFFQPYTCQKNIISQKSGFFQGMNLSIPFCHDVFEHKKKGEPLKGNISSANARIADICFYANSFKQAVKQLRNINNMVTLNVCKKK